MLKCRKCPGNFDPGDLVNGVCLDCLEEEKMEQLRNNRITNIMRSPCVQMELEEMLKCM